MNNELEEGKEKGGGGPSTVSKFDKQPQLKISLNEKEMEMIGLD